MSSLIILFVVLATIVLSFSVPGIVLSAPSIAGTLAAGLFLVLVSAGFTWRLQKHTIVLGKTPCFVGPLRFFLVVLFVSAPLLIHSEESGIKVQTNGGSIEVKTGTPPPAANPQVIVVRPAQPRAGCGCSLDTGASC